MNDIAMHCINVHLKCGNSEVQISAALTGLHQNQNQNLQRSDLQRWWNVNFEGGTVGTEQRGGSKVVVYGCSKEFCNGTLDLEGKISQI